MLLCTLLAILAAQAPVAVKPALSLPWVFADHMILQRDRPAPIWGEASPGTEIHVSFGGNSALAVATAAGTWRADLPAQEASAKGRELVISAGGTELRIQDVLVGEVWLCAGQSNMDFALGKSVGGPEAAAELPHAGLLRLCDRSGHPGGGARRFTAGELAGITPGSYYDGDWQVASAENAASFSAVGFYFGQRLRSELQGVPLGLIDVSVGGSTTEGWIPRERLAMDVDLAPLVDDYLATHLSHPFIRDRVSTQLGDWVDAGRAAPRPTHFFEPGFLFESALAELAPFGLRGVLWYQGESNAHLPRLADRLFRVMVEEWRDLWGRPELPIYYVQLPAMGRPTWPEFREVQASWLDIPHTGMAVAIDVGNPRNVHPTNKRPVGERLALLALAETYSREIAASGPMPVSIKRKGARLEILFQHADGLAWAAGRGQTGFEVSGKDRRFYPALAKIDADRVVLTSPEVAAPVDARYAWAPVPAWSLVNAAGLPAAPFRTHKWRPIRVACIGDSITAGAGLANPATESYPARLQQRLGDGFQVENFGHSGTCVVLTTMRKQWARAFRRNPEHQDALCFEPNIVISNLGINDIMAWSETGDAFVEDYVTLIDDYRGLHSSPTVLLWSPLAPLFKGQRFHGSPHETAIHKAIARVARTTRSAKIDMYDPHRDHPQRFPDHIHPNAAGAEATAGVVFEALVRERLARPDSRTLRLYVITGQSNSLGTTADPSDSDRTPGVFAADSQISFFWSNRSTRSGDGAAALIGDSMGQITSLKEQQGEGQNKTFWGPEFGFGRALFEAGERNFLIVKASRGGGGNQFWSKGGRDDHMYRHVVETVESAVAALPRGTLVETAALLYLQGESDSASEAAQAGRRLEAMAKNLRKDLPNAKGMRVVVGGIAAEGARRDLVREKQQEAAKRHQSMAYFSNLDLVAHLYDGLHFDRLAKLDIGKRFAAALQQLAAQRSGSSKR